MTASEDAHRGIQALLDLTVFAPFGLLLTAAQELPTLAARGRREVEGQIRNARAVGQMAVAMGRARLTPPAPPPARPGAGAPIPPSARAPRAPRQSGAPAGPSAPSETPGVGPPDQVIPGYDTLSASHVVRRLDGLSPGDLQAIYGYEKSHRGRSTVLARAEQLLRDEASTP